MKQRPDGFLGPDSISHNSEQFAYIAELHDYLWRFIRAATPAANGDLNDCIDRAVTIAESSPQVAPGLRELSTLANWILGTLSSNPRTRSEMQVSFYEYSTEEVDGAIDNLVHKNLIAADGDGRFKVIAADIAAQGGQVVDRDDDDDCKDAIGLNVRDERERCWWIVRNHPSRVNAHVQSVLKDIMVKIDSNTNDCTYSAREVTPVNSAVPSAPGGSEHGDALAYVSSMSNDNRLNLFAGYCSNCGDKYHSPCPYAPNALGTPQGSDSLSYTAETPTVEGWYWRKVHDHAGVVRVKKNYGNGTFYLWETPSRSIKPREFIEWAGPIPEPAHPVSADEAQERGDNE